MKDIGKILLCFVFLLSLKAAVPTPDSAMTFYMNKDPRKWTPQHQNANKYGFIMEFVPEGDSIKTWKEMAAQQIAFTKVPLRDYVDTWKKGLTKADPKAEIKEEAGAKDSIIVTYTSFAADEMSMRKFIQGKDGVYMLAYHVRPNLKKEATLKIWEEIIRGADLIPNPEKKRR